MRRVTGSVQVEGRCQGQGWETAWRKESFEWKGFSGALETGWRKMERMVADANPILHRQREKVLGFPKRKGALLCVVQDMRQGLRWPFP